MRKLLTLALFTITLAGITGTVSAKTYEPLKHKLTYPNPAEDFYLLDLDRDGAKELYTCKYGSTGYVYSFTANGTFQWHTWFRGVTTGAGCTQMGEDLVYIYVDDINNNKDLDIFAGSRVRGEKINLNPIYYFERETDPEQGTHKVKERWRFDDFQGILTDMTAADVNSDGTKEIIAASTGAFVYVIDARGIKKAVQDTRIVDGEIITETIYVLVPKVLNKYELDGAVHSIHASDIDGDGRQEIIAGTYNSVYLIDGSIKWRYEAGNRITGVYAAGLKGGSGSTVIATDGGRVYLIDVSGKLKAAIDAGDVADVAAADIDNDGSSEIIAAVGKDIQAFYTNGSFKWKFSVGEDIQSMKLLSANELVISTRKGITLLETDDEYAKNVEAYKQYMKAREYYFSRDCKNAQAPLEEALEIFTEIENIEGVIRCEEIKESCKGDYDKQRLADEYYGLAEKYFQDKSYEDARAYAERALEIYLDLKDNGAVVRKCGPLIQKIEKEEFRIKIESADKDYSTAYMHYSNDEFDDAVVHLDKALQTYRRLNYSKGIEDCERIYAEIGKKKGKNAADEFYEEGRTNFDLMGYEEAIGPLEQAMKLYTELKLGDEAEKAGSLKDRAEKYVEGKGYHALAQECYEKEEYVNATYYAEKSKDIYMELEDYDKAADTVRLIGRIEQKIGEKRMYSPGNIATVVAAIIFIIIAAVFTIKKLKKR
ncbi:MAG: hypothetical protein JW724_04330 [Candidatus Altiarchaeota archaeon]|nr:hypothetical protein [Candidatus Altiarchaeota archaeon]